MKQLKFELHRIDQVYLDDSVRREGLALLGHEEIDLPPLEIKFTKTSIKEEPQWPLLI